MKEKKNAKTPKGEGIPTKAPRKGYKLLWYYSGSPIIMNSYKRESSYRRTTVPVGTKPKPKQPG